MLLMKLEMWKVLLGKGRAMEEKPRGNKRSLLPY